MLIILQTHKLFFTLKMAYFRQHKVKCPKQCMHPTQIVPKGSQEAKSCQRPGAARTRRGSLQGSLPQTSRAGCMGGVGPLPYSPHQTRIKRTQGHDPNWAPPMFVPSLRLCVPDASISSHAKSKTHSHSHLIDSPRPIDIGHIGSA